MNKKELILKLKKIDIIKEVVELGNGNLQIQTVFQHFDDLFIDLFIENIDRVDPQEKFQLTDLGKTFDELESKHIKTFQNVYRVEIDKTLVLHKVELQKDKLTIQIDNVEHVFDTVISLFQACAKISGIIFIASIPALDRMIRERIDKEEKQNRKLYDSSF